MGGTQGKVDHLTLTRSGHSCFEVDHSFHCKRSQDKRQESASYQNDARTYKCLGLVMFLGMVIS